MDKVKISGTTNKSCTVKVLRDDWLIATKPVSQGSYSMVIPMASGIALDTIAIDSSGEMDAVGDVTPIVTTDDVDSFHPVNTDIIHRRNRDVWELDPAHNNGSFTVNSTGSELSISINSGGNTPVRVINPLLVSGDFDSTVHYHRDNNHTSPDWGTAFYMISSVDNTTYVKARQTGDTVRLETVVSGTTLDGHTLSGYTIDYDYNFRLKRVGDVVSLYNPLNTSSFLYSHAWSTDDFYMGYTIEHWASYYPHHVIKITSHYVTF